MNHSHLPLQKILKFSQLVIAILWIYQGLIPKLIFQVQDEHYVWQQLNIAAVYIPWMISCSGLAEIIFGSLFLFLTHKYLHWFNIISLIGLFIVVLLIYPDQLYQAFNPVVMNIALGSLSLISLWCIDALQSPKPE
ncbi:DoxX-like family protein [Acinetobacter proteolyticus]|uniref:DoxX-like family protein n=1 Tax=Acinetobacter proteolyticus TaxID=1776741 RepID=UPI0008634EE9|nr:DoxX-like family protein [Acinetobacter proteolyticus]OEY92620.1 DoxX-like family protein [Acinetobacter proteolyticus]